MSPYLCHDFKTPRTDTSRRLPNSFRLIPIAFYLAMVAGAYFVTMDVLNYRAAKKDKAQFDQIKAQHEAEKVKFEEQTATLNVETARAQEVAKWVEGTRAMQPICVKIGRSISAEARLSELTLERNEQLPNQLVLTMKLSGGDVSEVQKIQTNIEQLNYRAYSPQQSKQGEVVDYRSNLVWQQR
jgi:succinyl-CoA synthetase beta subunit